MIRHLQGDCRWVLQTLPERSVHCCVTSPPYWGLRDYRVEPLAWGGDPRCAHAWGEEMTAVTDHRDKRRWNHAVNGRGEVQLADRRPGGRGPVSLGRSCRCGAWLGCLGLEPTPGRSVGHLVEVFRAVRRVLRDDGTVWLNLGDCYAGARGAAGGIDPGPAAGDGRIDGGVPAALKPKDLVGLPWRAAFALQADGWCLRSDVIWAKPNCMPESVGDRPTRPTGTRNRRTVWSVPTRPYAGAHFAVFPPGLVRPCVLAGCPPGGTVLDPFGGSGTTGLVAEQEDRDAILIEMNPDYVRLQRERTVQASLLAA